MSKKYRTTDGEMTAREADAIPMTPVEELEKQAFIAEHPEEFTDDNDEAKVWQSIAGRTNLQMGPSDQPVPVNRIPEDDFYDTETEAKR